METILPVKLKSNILNVLHWIVFLGIYTKTLIWKDPDAGEDWGQEEKGTTEDEMVGWHHWLDGHEFG